jgi:integrase
MTVVRVSSGAFEVRIIRKKALQQIGFDSGKYTFTVTNQEDANFQHDKICAAIDAGKIPKFLVDLGKQKQRETSRVTIAKMWHLMQLDPYEHYSTSTTKLVESLLDSMGDVVMRDFDKTAMLEWIDDLKGLKNVPGTIRKKVGAIRTIFRYAAIDKSENGLDNNVFDLLPKDYSQYKGHLNKRNRKVVRDDSRERRLLPGEEILIYSAINTYRLDPRRKAIKDEFKPALRLLFKMAINTGMRLQEIFLLKWDDIKFGDKPYIKIHQENTKSNKTRHLLLTSAITPVLLHYQRFQNSRYPYVLPFMDFYGNNIKSCSEALSQTWGRLMDHGEIDNLRFHDLRHEAISRMAERTNLTVAQMMSMSGHSSMKLFQRYANLRPEELGDMY